MMPGFVLLVLAAALLAAGGLIGGFLAGLMTIAGMADASAAAALYLEGAVIILALVAVVLMLGGVVVARLEYANYAFSFEEFDLKMRRGILHRVENSIPYRQIQDVDVDRSFTHQLLGLSKVTIITAGHEEAGERGEAEVILEPLSKNLAEAVRLILERKIGVQVVENQSEADGKSLPSKP